MNRVQSVIEHSLGYVVDWGDTAAWLALLLAGVGAVGAFVQIKANAALARENTALEAHRQLLCLCIERPELSSSDLMLKHLGRADFVGVDRDLTPESERALWFLSYLLNAMEQVLESKPRDTYWHATIAAQLKYHAALIGEVWCDWKGHYGRQFQMFVEKALPLPECPEAAEAT